MQKFKPKDGNDLTPLYNALWVCHTEFKMIENVDKNLCEAHFRPKVKGIELIANPSLILLVSFLKRMEMHRSFMGHNRVKQSLLVG